VTRSPDRDGDGLAGSRGKRNALLLGLAAGAGVWLLSRPLTGRIEPWDAEGLYYPGALFLGGLVGGWLAPGAAGAVALGVLGGQLLVFAGRILLGPGDAGLWPLGLVFLVLSTLVPLVGAVVGKAGRRLAARI
jgi:hypothetical protein